MAAWWRGVFFFFFFYASGAQAACYRLASPTTRVIGQNRFITVKKGESFAQIGAHEDLGYDALSDANPAVDAVHPLVHAALLLPSRVIMPPGPHQGMVVNIAQKRLYAFYHHGTQVCTYPLGVGEQHWATPEGQFHIIKKIKNPVWYVPDSIFQHRQALGKPVPHVVPSGPDNPLGYYAMRLNNITYLIHGTDDPSSVGRRSSAGCMHLFAPDIQALFKATPVGTGVRIVNAPYALARDAEGVWWFQAHPMMAEMKASLPTPKARAAYLQAFLTASFTPDALRRYGADAVRVAALHTGVAVALRPAV